MVRTKNKKEENIVHGAECFSGAPLPEMLLLSSDLAHLCLTPSTFENLTFFVRSHHTKKYHPPRLIRKRREIHIPWPASAQIPPGLKPEFLFCETDG
jgi:hypothetical protein